jgi:hypothetical protein
MRMWTGFNRFTLRPLTGTYEHGNEPPNSIKNREFSNQVNSYQLLNDCSMEQVSLAKIRRDEEESTFHPL